MHLEIPLLESSKLFDTKPLKKKIHQKEINQLFRKKVSNAFQLCQSSYIQTELNDTIQIQLGRSRSQTQRIYERNASNKNQVLEKIFQSKIPEVKNIFVNANQRMYEVMSSVIHEYEKCIPSQNSTKGTKSTHATSKTQLSESNKNFLVQLFTEAGLLKFYKGMDRTFTTLISQAQKAYYGIKSFVKSESRILQGKDQKKIKEYVKDLEEDKRKVYDTVNDILSLKKRHKEASQKLKIKNRDYSIAKGYSTDRSKKPAELLQKKNDQILADTKDTRKEKNQLNDESSIPQQKNEKIHQFSKLSPKSKKNDESSEVSNGLFFDDVSSRCMYQVEENWQDDQTNENLVNYLEGTHGDVQRFAKNFGYENILEEIRDNKHTNNLSSWEQLPRKLKFS